MKLKAVNKNIISRCFAIKVSIRLYREDDAEALYQLFYDTVHFVNCRDYTLAQCDAWAPKDTNIAQWRQSFLQHYCLVAVKQKEIVGFGDIDRESAYLDRLFVHRDYQGVGIGFMLCTALEAVVSKPVMTHASITAKPFFMRRGYGVCRRRVVERRGMQLINYVMKQDIWPK